MPQEFLRDVLRTDDAAGRSRRRLFLFPVSLAVHAAGALAYLMVPLAAEVTLPAPAPLASRRWVMPVATPPPVQPPVNVQKLPPSIRSAAAPIEAPSKIAPEVPEVMSLPAPGGIEGLPGDSVAVPDGSAAGTIAPPPPVAPPPAPVERRPVRIGGAIRPPTRISASAPVYPPVAIHARVEGRVLLEALIDEQGRVGSMRVITSVPLLDTAAMDAVRTWRYTPTLLNGVPVPVLMTVTVSFTLQR